MPTYIIHSHHRNPMSPTVTTTSTNNISPIAEKERTKKRPHTRSVKMFKKCIHLITETC